MVLEVLSDVSAGWDRVLAGAMVATCNALEAVRKPKSWDARCSSHNGMSTARLRPCVGDARPAHDPRSAGQHNEAKAC